MDYQPLVPPPQGAAPPPMPAEPTPSMAPMMPMTTGSGYSSGGSSPIMLILVVILALGTVVFGIMTIVFYNQAQTAQRTVDTQKAAAVAAAVKQQEATDDANYAKASESPFRAYTAPNGDGAFVINFPKNWSGWVDEENSGNNVNLILNPDFVRVAGGVNVLAATTVKLIQNSATQYMLQFNSYIQEGSLHQKNITVSGIQGYDLTGTFSDQRTTREVVVPVRDKVLVFTNENAKYAAEFDEVLAQAKINP
jgi:Na+-transporting NADH:ubiquinone oxidoreductase subunit NqrC